MDILAYVSCAEANTPSAKIALCIVALNIYGWGCEGLSPGRRQGKHQRVSTNVAASSITKLDIECAARARQLWSRGVRLSNARACYEPAAQDRLYRQGYEGYRYSSDELHRHWIGSGEILVLERWGWRFYTSASHMRKDVAGTSKGGQEWQTRRDFLSWLGVN